jgi:hypothetical protein
VDEVLVHLADDRGGEEPHVGLVEQARLLPHLRQHHAGEGQVPGLLLAVVAVDRAHERVGAGVVGRPLLQQVGDLLAGEDHRVQQRRVVDHLVDDDGAHGVDQPVVHRVRGGRAQLVEQAGEQPRVACLLAHLVQEVGDAGIGEVGRPGDAQPEAGDEDRLELEAGAGDRGERQAAELRDPLLRERALVEAGGAEQEVGGQHLALPQPARQVGVRVDDPGLRGGVQLADAFGDGGRCHCVPPHVCRSATR